jgi:hypothetical protein
MNFSIIASSLDQFEIRNLLSSDATILNDLHIPLTNIGLYLTGNVTLPLPTRPPIIIGDEIIPTDLIITGVILGLLLSIM